MKTRPTRTGLRILSRTGFWPLLLGLLAVLLVAAWSRRPSSTPSSQPPRVATVTPTVKTATAMPTTPPVPSPTPAPSVRPGQLASPVRTLAALHRDFWLHAAGAQLYTAWGSPVTLKAINWYGFEYPPFVPDGLNRAPLDVILATLHAQGFNALRITFADQTVESNPVVTTGLDANPQLRGLHALDIMGRLIARAHHFGLRVILCNSRSEAGYGPERTTGLWYTSRYPASAWENDWITLARRFRDDSAFVGADLRNEPHVVGATTFNEGTYFGNGPLWGSYRGTYFQDRDWHLAAQTLGNSLLAVNPHLLIIVEGVQIYLDPDRNVMTGGLWGSNLVGVQYDPIALSRPSQLVYSVHEYGPQMWQASWFTPHTTYASLARRWNRLWGYLLRARKLLRAPIFVGEFGTCHEYYSCTTSDEGWKQGFWFKSFVRYLASHPDVGWAYWALNPTGPFGPNEVDYYSLVSMNWKHYYPLVTEGLAPLLRGEPSGIWPGTIPTRKTPVMSREPDCPLHASCTSLSETRSHTWAPIRPPPPGAIQVSRDVPYISSAGPYRRGDLYLPQKRTKARSAVIIVHGPDWSTGRKGTPGTARLALALARHGYLAFDVDYRPVGHAGGFPRAIRDVKAAAAYLSVNAAALHVDPAKIAVIGAGSGGYLAMMAADTPNQPPFMPRDYTASEIHLAAVASFFAPTDLTASSDPAEIAAIAAFLRAGKLTPATAGPAQPLTYASRAVPTIFFYGRQDRANPFAPIFRLYRAIKRRSIPAQLIEVNGAPRAFADLTGAERSSAIRQLELFLDSVLYNQTQQ